VNIDSAIADPVPLGCDLIKRAQEGDADAFGSLFQANRSRIYSVCLRMTSNAAEAEDLTQDTFLHVFRKINKFRGDSAFSTWLHRIAVNTVLMHFRKNSLNQVSLDEPQRDMDGAHPQRRFFKRVRQREEHHLQHLPRRARERGDRAGHEPRLERGG